MKRDESGCVAPMHGEIKTGTFSGILKQAGVSVEEFIAALAGEISGLPMKTR